MIFQTGPYGIPVEMQQEPPQPVRPPEVELRAHVIGALMSVGAGQDVPAMIRKAKQICDFIETGKMGLHAVE